MLKGMSQESLADSASLGLRTIQRIENNESKPTGETLKRLSYALGADIGELIDHRPSLQSTDIDGTISLLSDRLSRTEQKSEISVLEDFISVLENIQEKDMSPSQMDAIKSYIQYLELDKVPPYSQELYKEKFKNFKSFLRSKLKFVPSNHYTYWTFIFSLPFTLTFSLQEKIEYPIKIAVLLIACLAVGFAALLDLRIKNQNRSLRF